MGRLNWVSIVFACAAVSLAVGAGAFSSVSADRGVEVSVVDDEEAMLGIETAGDGEIESDNPTHDETLITFYNRLGGKIELTADISEPKPTQHPKLKDYSLSKRTLEPGDRATLSADINCNNGNATSDEDWNVAIDATGETVSVETTETITVECTGNGEGRSDGTGQPDTHSG